MKQPGETRKKGLLVLLVAVLVLALGGAWWTWGRAGTAESDRAAVEGDDAPKVDRKDALRKKRADRNSLVVLDPVGVGGRVTRADDGGAIAGAVVLLARKGVIQGQAPGPGESSRALIAVTDANGGWQIESVGAGRYLLSATARGFRPATRTDLRVTGGRDQMDFNLEMRAGGHSISGVVADIGGGPVEGVLVQARDGSGTDFGFKHAPLASVSDENGRYSLHVGNGRYVLTTTHSDYVGQFKYTEVRDADRVENFELVPGGSVEGVVLTRGTGEPVAGARVTFADSRNGDRGGFTTNLSSDGTIVISDAEGRFRIEGLRAGVVTLSARARGSATPSPVEVPMGIGEQVSGVELSVDPAFTISGFVVPEGDLEGAIGGVLVGAWQMQPPSLLVASEPSSADGYFEIVGVPSGAWQVGAVGEDTLLTLTGATVVLTDEDATDVIIALETGVYVRGRVDPGLRARLRLRPNAENTSLGNLGATIGDSVVSATSDDEGNFVLGPIHPGGELGGGRTVTLVAENDEGFRGELDVSLGGEDLEGVVVPMTKGATVSGTVRDESGVPQAGVTVSVTPAKKDASAMAVNLGGAGRLGSGVPTDEQGKFSIRGLDLGDQLVLVKDSKGRALAWAPGSGPDVPDGGEDRGEHEVEPLRLTLEDAVNDPFLELRVLPRDGVISGLVLDADGMPLPDAWVTAALDIDGGEYMRGRNPSAKDETERVSGVEPEDEDEVQGRDWTQSAFFSESPVLSDENGLFVIKNLRRDRPYNLVAEGERGGARATQSGVLAGARVTLVLESLGGIEGRVSARGKAVTQYTLAASGPVARSQRIHDEAGNFSLLRLDPGTYTLTVTCDAGSAIAEVELGDSGREHVEIQLEDWGAIRGRVVGMGDGEPLPGLMLVVRSEGGNNAGAGMGVLTGKGPKTKRDGGFEVEDISAGKGSVVFLDPDLDLSDNNAVAIVEFEIEAGETLDLGTVKGVQDDTVPKDERGTLDMRVTVASFADRPRPPGTDLSKEEPPAEPADESKRLWVRSVEVGGVAETAGVVPGDEVLSIDGRAVAGLGAGTARELLSTSRIRSGQGLRIEFGRGDDRFDATLKAVAKDP